MKRVLGTTIKFALSAGLVTFLVYKLWSGDPTAFEQVIHGPKRWDLLVLAWLCCTAAVAVTFVRWHLLVRALGIPFRMKDAFRLGLLGFFWNFFSLGTVGGDVFKAFFIAREQHGRRAEAVASVIVDRIVGLYALLLVASGAILLTGAYQTEIVSIEVIVRAIFVATGIGTAVMVLLFMPGQTSTWLTRPLAKLPKVGPMSVKLIDAVRMYRKSIGAVVVSTVMSLSVHILTALGVYFGACALTELAVPGLEAHLVMVPLAMVTGILPLPGNALGAIELALNFLYHHAIVAGQYVTPFDDNSGVYVVLIYRMITVVIAAMGAWYYMVARRDVAIRTAVEHAGDNLDSDLDSSDEESSAVNVRTPAIAKMNAATLL